MNPSQQQSRVRYIVRVEAPTGMVKAGKAVYRIEEVSSGADKGEQVAFAIRHHDRHNLKTWVLDLRYGDTIFELKPTQAASGGAA